MKSVAGKNVLITGAAMGMGKIFAQRAVKEKAAVVVVWDINEGALKETAAELERSGVRVVATVVDVCDEDAIAAAAAQVLADVGPIHVLVNNAGIVRGNKYFWEHKDAADIRLTMAINSLAPMYVSRPFLPPMIEGREECRVLNVASAAGLVSNPRMAVYAASKWAAIGFSDSLRLELEQAGHSHVKVTTLCPTYIATGMFEGAKGPLLTPMMTPEDVVAEGWKQMKKGTPMVLLPWTVRLSKVIKGVLPTRPWDVVAGRVFGVYSSMDEFKGRDKT